MRLCWAPLISDRSGDLCGSGLVVYELAGILSRAFSSSALAAFAMAADVFGRVVRLGEPGFRGRGGGARSGSELSHLRDQILVVSGMFFSAFHRRNQEEDCKRTLGCVGPSSRLMRKNVSA
jgi:hypothetical protein